MAKSLYKKVTIRAARNHAEGTEDNEYLAGLDVAAGIVEDLLPNGGR